MRKFRSFTILVLITVMASGCAFGTRRPTLEYTSVIPARSSNNITLKVGQFEDNRPDKNIVGNVRNGWGIKTADVITDTNISEWITNALKSELKNAGYTIVDANVGNELRGEVLKIYCDAFLNYEGEAMIKVVLKKDNNVLLDKVFSGKATDLNWAATAKSYGTILQRSLQQAMIQVVAEVDRVLKQ